MSPFKPLHDEGIKEEIEIKSPKMYKVLLLNDDYTSMDFVVNILMKIFHKSQQEAYEIMLRIHKDGSGLCGVYTYEIAETKVSQVINAARKNDYPLRAVMEEE